jgi:hypothetical protein
MLLKPYLSGASMLADIRSTRTEAKEREMD